MIDKIGQAVQSGDKVLAINLLMEYGYSEHEAWQFVSRHMDKSWRTVWINSCKRESKGLLLGLVKQTKRVAK